MLEIRNCFKLVLTSEDIFNKQNDKKSKDQFWINSIIPKPWEFFAPKPASKTTERISGSV
jgi:hypothetical protein